MTVDVSLGVVADRVASRERDVQRAFYPGTFGENTDVAGSNDGTRAVPNPLSVALPQNTYAITLDASGKRQYTRDGAFDMREGSLIDAGGNAVQGYITPHGALSELRVADVDARLGRIDALRIESDGRLTYLRLAIDPRTGTRIDQRVTVGRLALARFPAGSALHAIDGIHASAPADTIPHVGTPGNGGFGLLAPQRLTKSHIDLDASLIKLQESYFALDALRAAKQAYAGSQKTAIDLIK